jgi:molecular chaperone DnaK (HSP70)
MPYVLGIDLGSGHTAAAICRNERDHWSDPELLRLGAQSPAVASVLHLTTDGAVEVGEWAAPGAPAHRIARGFVDRIGDEVPFSLGGQHYLAEVLAAALVGWVADTAEAAEGAPATQVVVTHPAGWGTHRRTVLQHALREAGLTDLTLLPRPVAAAERHTAVDRVDVGDEVAVYALGHSRFEAAILRRGSFSFELRGHAESAAELGGSLFDDLLVDHVLAELGGGEPTAQLRFACTAARERLSVDTSVSIPATLAGLPDPDHAVVVYRPDLERLIRPAVESTVAVLTRTVRTAGTEPGELHGVLLVGGCARTPLVAELVSAGLRARTIAAPEPAAAVALGAALAGTKIAKPTVRAAALAPSAVGVSHTDLLRMSDYSEDEHFADLDEIVHIGPPPPRPPVDVPPLDPPQRGLRRLLGRRDDDYEPDDLDDDPEEDVDAEEDVDVVDWDDVVPDPVPRARRRSSRTLERDGDDR